MVTRRPGYNAAALLSQNNAAPPGPQVTTDYTSDLSANLTPVAGWGTLLRNHAYAGPAMTVEDNANPGTTTDVSFNSAGLIRGALPFGTDTRVVTLYDQFGTSHMYATLADDVRIREDDGTYGTWLLDFQGSGGLTTTDVASGGQVWELGTPVWVCGHKRTYSNQLKPIWGIAQASNYMTVGLWEEYQDLNWRINGSSAVDWTNTDWFDNADVVQVPGIDRTIGDVSAGSPGLGYFNGVLESSLTHTSPITYDVGQPVNIGTGLISNDFNGLVSEVVIFNPAAALSVSDRTILDDALAEANYFLTAEEVATYEHREYVIVGGSSAGVVAKNQRTYAVLGGSADINAKSQRLYSILGGTQDLGVRTQRLYAIIVP